MSISQLYGGYGLNRNIVHNFLHAPSSANAGKGFVVDCMGHCVLQDWYDHVASLGIRTQWHET